MRKETRRPITQELILELFSCDFAAGRMFWKSITKYHPALIGQEAGGPQKNRNGKAYWTISLFGTRYKRARLLYLAYHGRFPSPCCDHEDGDSLNDAISNLREATVLQNAWNHKTRARRINLPMGVRENAHSGRFAARIAVRGRLITIGTFDTPSDAHAAYLKARKENYGEFA